MPALPNARSEPTGSLRAEAAGIPRRATPPAKRQHTRTIKFSSSVGALFYVCLSRIPTRGDNFFFRFFGRRSRARDV